MEHRAIFEVLIHKYLLYKGLYRFHPSNYFFSKYLKLLDMARNFVSEGRYLVSNCGQVHTCEANRKNWVVGKHDSIQFWLIFIHFCHAFDESFERRLFPSEVSKDKNVENKLSFGPCA